MKEKLLIRENIGLICTIAQTVIGFIALFTAESGAIIWIILFVVSLFANAVMWYQYRKYKKLYDLMCVSPYFNTIKHLINSRKKKHKNNFRLDCLKVSYIFSDNLQHDDMLDNTIKFYLKGKNIASTSECIYLQLSTSKGKNIEKITVTGYDNLKNKDVTSQNPSIGDGYILYKIPFFGPLHEHDEIDYTITVEWKNFSGKRNTDLIILDPLKYAEEIFNSIDIEIKNLSQNLKIDQALIRTFDRKELSCSDSFVFTHSDKVNQEFSHTIKEGDFNENSVFGISFGKDTI